MSRIVKCAKLNIEAEGLARPPMPGELGAKIYENISQQAWDEWLAHQTMLINEYKLSSIDKDDRAFLRIEMQKFLFGEGGQKPPGFTE